MEDERQVPQPLPRVPYLGRAWVIPHALLGLLSVALPIVASDVWDWSTATGGGGFFGAMVVLDLLQESRRGNSVETRTLLPGEPEPKRGLSPLWLLAMALLFVSVLSLIYATGVRLEFWRPI